MCEEGQEGVCSKAARLGMPGCGGVLGPKLWSSPKQKTIYGGIGCNNEFHPWKEGTTQYTVQGTVSHLLLSGSLWISLERLWIRLASSLASLDALWTSLDSLTL